MPFGDHPQPRRVGAHPDPVDPAHPPCQPRGGGDQTGHLLPRRVAQRPDRGEDPRRVAWPVERSLLLQRPSPAGRLDREEADEAALGAEPGRAEVGGEGPEREAGGGRRGAERGGRFGEDGVAEAGEEAGMGGVEGER